MKHLFCFLLAAGCAADVEPELAETAAALTCNRVDGDLCLANCTLVSPRIERCDQLVCTTAGCKPAPTLELAPRQLALTASDTRIATWSAAAGLEVVAPASTTRLECNQNHAWLSPGHGGSLAWAALAGVAGGASSASGRREGRVRLTPQTDLDLVSQADVDRDGCGDLIWRSPQTGAVELVLGCETTTAAAVTPVPSTAWTLIGARDTSLFWRNGTSVRSWRMNGATVVSDTTTTVPTAWLFGALGDFDGDGSADLLWRDSSTTARIWYAGNPQQSSRSFPLAASYVIDGAHDVSGSVRAELVAHVANVNVPTLVASPVPELEGIVVTPSAWRARW